MKTNIAILLIVATITYALTLYLSDNNINTNINNVPNKSAIEKQIKGAQIIPDFTFTDINGEQKSASDFEGKIIILNFWASWCAPCIKEFPNLLDIAKTNKDTVILIALSSDLDEAAIQKFITKGKAMESFNGLDFNATNIHIALDKNQQITAGKFSTFKLPETLIIDRNQNLRHKLIGADWTREDLQNIIESL